MPVDPTTASAEQLARAAGWITQTRKRKAQADEKRPHKRGKYIEVTGPSRIPDTHMFGNLVVKTPSYDKKLVSILKQGIGDTQVSTTIFNAIQPCTIKGVRWSLTAVQDAGDQTAEGFWAIVKVPEGRNANVVGFTQGGPVYSPPVLVVGSSVWGILNKSGTSAMIGSSQRHIKMSAGDQLVLIANGTDATNTSSLFGTVQGFCLE